MGWLNELAAEAQLAPALAGLVLALAGLVLVDVVLIVSTRLVARRRSEARSA